MASAGQRVISRCATVTQHCSSRHRVYCAAAPQHHQQQQLQQHTPINPLRDWITANGGYIHPTLQLVDNAPTTKCRGVITTAPISLEDLEAGPLISVPQDLQFTSAQACKLIQAISNSHELVAAAREQLTDTQIIAAALAYYSRQLTRYANSADSNSSRSSDFWHPYILSLPVQPPNPWLLEDHCQIAAAIEPYATSRGSSAVADWHEAVAHHRQQMLKSAAEVEQVIGSVLQISTNDTMTALGQVMSRSLTSSSNSSGLVPFVDLLNHGPGARAPMLQLDDNDKLVVTVLPIYNGEAVALAAGDELLISYQGGYTPLDAFLKFGFVADEWWLD